jgi:ABC-2 type transport system permease protein
MRLLRVELKRFRARRAVILLLVAAFLVAAAVLASAAWNTRPVPEAEREAFLEQIEIERQDPARVIEYERCQRQPERYGIPEDSNVKRECDLAILPQPEWFSPRSELDLAQELEGSAGGVVALLAVMFVLAGTTFAGHDWSSGSMSNQLLFEPRRTRVWLAKGLAVGLTALVAGAAVLAAYWAGLWLVARTRDITTPASVLTEIQWTSMRGVLFATAAALGAYAVTMLFRSTVATLGILFAVSLLGPLLLALIGFDGYERWMPNVNFSAILRDGTTYFDESAIVECTGDTECGQEHLSLVGGVLYYGAMLGLACLVSLWSFRRRDVP